MDFLDSKLNLYTETHTSSENDVLESLNRETNAKILMPRMLSGHLQGRILSMLSHMIRPKQILEIGTYTGYSALCLAEGLQDDGCLHTIDINDELKSMVRTYIRKASMQEKIKTYYGNALDIIPGLDIKFDLVFIDADKINYSKYYDLVIDKIPSGAFILADNVLWSGKILDDELKMDSDTKSIHAFNQKIQQDTRIENVLLPVRDGIMLIRKK
ncbi:MAG: O-methyltransferase [Bacteroidetes bacterium]|nr:MAG: O-methyltransferase [Bacteroidota bacterium]